jgi:hypothetical protein
VTLLLSFVRERRKTLAQSVEQSSPEQLLTTLVDLFVRLYCESSADTDAIARAWAVSMSPGPEVERIDGAVKLFAAAGFGELAPEEVQGLLRHPSFQAFENLLHQRHTSNGAHDQNIELDDAAHWKLAKFALEACS